MQHKLFLLSALVIAFAACNDNEPTVINYFIDDNPAVVQGQLSGKFSVSATKKVSFSQGNLQYNAAQNVWRFADNQYDYVGDDTRGTVKIGDTKCSNKNVSNDYNGWIDMFGWGTGSNPTKSVKNYTEYSTFVDWGKNRIYNGGDKVELWRTMDWEEWLYILHGRKNAENLFALGCIFLNDDKTESINGIILLPDNWKKPAESIFNKSVGEDGLKWVEKDTCWHQQDSNHYLDNEYTIDQWSDMESAGAVFLPATWNVTEGYYWATKLIGERAYDFYFGKQNVIGMSHYNPRYQKFSVRLVR